MAEAAESGPSLKTGGQSSDSRFRLLVVSVVLLVFGAIAGYAFGIYSSNRAMKSNALTMRQLTDNVQTLERTISSMKEINARIQAEVGRLRNTMEEMVPAKDTYEIRPNHSIIVAGGHLTIGLVGSPSNKAINININGKVQSAAAGDVVKIDPDPSTNCRVTIQSFDMFKAAVRANCDTNKAQ